MTPYKEYDNADVFLKDTDLKNTYESLKKNICMRVFNKDNLPFGKNRTEIPYFKWADLAITFAVEKKMYIGDNLGRGYYMLGNDFLEENGISREELRKTAESNMNFKNGPRIESITKHLTRSHVLHPVISMPKEAGVKLNVRPETYELHSLFQAQQYGEIPVLPDSIRSLLGQAGPEKESEQDNENVLIVSNRTMSFASVNMFIGNTIADVYNRFNEDFYIIPLSVHECMCVKESHALRDANTVKEAEEDLNDMLEQINDKLITDEQDILSYSIYKYFHDEGMTMIINS